MERALVVNECRRLSPAALDAATLEAMWALFDAHYRGISRAVFERDLFAKGEVLLLERGGRLTGFTSLSLRQLGRWWVVYSGDIVVAADCRDLGTARLFGGWTQAVWGRADWWCALSSGPRTHRLCHQFFHRVTPGPGIEECRQESELRRIFAVGGYGDCYDAESGVVTLPEAYEVLGGRAPRSEDPVDRLFMERNPHWSRGDELVSLVSLKAENWKPATLRLLRWGQPQ